MRRDDLIRLKMAGTALAKAASEALDDEARHEWDHNGSAASWRTTAGTAYANISHDRVEVVDEEQFLAWLEKHHPTEVVMRRVIRNSEWQKAYLESLAKAIKTGEADAPPGTKPKAGGDFRNVTVRPDADVAEAVARVATLAVQRGEGFTDLAVLLDRADQLIEERRKNGV